KARTLPWLAGVEIELAQRPQLEPMLQMQKAADRCRPGRALEILARQRDVVLHHPHYIARSDERGLGVAVATTRGITHVFQVSPAQLLERAEMPKRERDEDPRRRELPRGARGFFAHDALGLAQLSHRFPVFAGEKVDEAERAHRPRCEVRTTDCLVEPMGVVEHFVGANELASALRAIENRLGAKRTGQAPLLAGLQ